MFIFMELWGFFPVVTAKFVEVGSLPKLTVVWVCCFFFHGSSSCQSVVYL